MCGLRNWTFSLQRFLPAYKHIHWHRHTHSQHATWNGYIAGTYTPMNPWHGGVTQRQYQFYLPRNAHVRYYMTCSLQYSICWCTDGVIEKDVRTLLCTVPIVWLFQLNGKKIRERTWRTAGSVTRPQTHITSHGTQPQSKITCASAWCTPQHRLDCGMNLNVYIKQTGR